jgi:hypothetical protein
VVFLFLKPQYIDPKKFRKKLLSNYPKTAVKIQPENP